MQKTNLYYDNDVVIKAQSIEKDFVYGYDIITEEFCKRKLADLLPITKPIINLIGDEKLRLLIALNCSKTRKELTSLLNCTDRTTQRLLAKYNLADESKQELGKNSVKI